MESNIVNLDPEINQLLIQDFPGQPPGFVQVGPAEYLLPQKYRDFVSELQDFKLRPDDVWIVTFPRSGTTVTQEMLWLLANDLDFKRADEESLKTRSRFIEFGILCSEAYEQQMLAEVRGDKEKEEKVARFCGSRVPVLDAQSSPRVIKTHLPLSLLPPQLLDTCKVVYVARNPRDVATSYFHFSKNNVLFNYQGDFPEFWNHFRHGHVIYGPHWHHVTEAWKLRNHPNMHFTFYEHFTVDMAATIEQISSHLDKRMEQVDVEKLKRHLNIENFRRNKQIHDSKQNLEYPGLPNTIDKDFIRKGKNNDWKELFTPEMKMDSDRWISETYNFDFPSD